MVVLWQEEALSKDHSKVVKALQQPISRGLVKCGEAWTPDMPTLDNDNWDDL